MPKLITVFGATGVQGCISLPQEFRVRGITRDAKKKSAQDLAERGVEIVTADLNSISSLESALKGSHTVFLVTNHWEGANTDMELTQGRNVTDVAKAAGVKHLIFSSLHSVIEGTKGKYTTVLHNDGKADIEKYIRESNIPATFVLAGYYMSNYKENFFLELISKNADGIYQLQYPFDGKKRIIPLIDDAEDTGLFVKSIIKNAESLIGKRILAAENYYPAEDIMEGFSTVTGKKGEFVQVSPDQFKAIAPPEAGVEFLDTHKVMDEYGYYFGESLDESLKLLEAKPTSLSEYFKKNISAWE